MKNKYSRILLACNDIALSTKAVIVLLAALTIYHQDLILVGNEAAKSEMMSHMLAMPFLFAYLVYRKRKMLKATILLENPKPFHEIVGVTLCLIALLLYWHGSYTFQPLEYHMASLPLFVAGCILIMFNAQTLKVLAFPLAFLLFLIPPPLKIIYAAGTTLSTISSEVAYKVLKAIGLPISLAARYGTPTIILEKSEGLPLAFAIDIACSGIYSLIGFATFAVFAAYVVRGTTWKKATMFFTGFPLIYALNITRIIIIVLIGYQYGMEIAMQAFHRFGGGVLIFLGTLLLLYLSEKIWKIQIFNKKSKTIPCLKCSESPGKEKIFCPSCGRLLRCAGIKVSRRDLCKITALLISASLIMLLQVPVFALAEGPAEVVTQLSGGEQVSTQILPDIPDYTLQFIERNKGFEEIAKQEASLTFAYVPTEGSKTKIWVIIEIASSRTPLHPWEACLITWPQTHGRQPVTQLDLRDVQLLQNPPVIGRYFAFQDTRSNMIQVILYWYENAVFNTGSGLRKEYAKISLIAYTNDSKDVPKIEQQLLPFGEAIVNYWQPIKKWSQITLVVAQNGITLIAVAVAFLGVVIGNQVIKNQKEKKSNLKVYSNLAPEEKLIPRAVYQAAKRGKATGDAIASAYQRLAKRPIQSSVLFEKLDQAEEAGLVERGVISQDDEPVLVWKSRVPLKHAILLSPTLTSPPLVFHDGAE